MSRLTIRCATALVGRSLEETEDASIVVEDGLIAELGVRTADGEIFDARGMTLVPGFIDAHVHIGFHDPHDVLTGGVTTVRDLGWPEERIFPMVEASREQGYDGPEILAAGPILTAPGGYPTRAAWAPPGTGREVASIANAERAVEETAAHGASVIKVALNPPAGPTFETNVLAAIVHAAHARGLKVTGHVDGLAELHRALDAGLDELAHMLMGNDTIPAATIERMVDAGMTVVPTLSCRFGAERATAIANLERFRAAGGNVVYGTDLGNEGPGPGIDRREVEAMNEAGSSVREIIESATVGAARWLGLDDRGRIEPGLRADLVAFRKLPTEARDLVDVAAVWRSGELRKLDL